MNEAPAPKGEDVAGKWILAIILAAIALVLGHAGWRFWAFVQVNQEWNALWAAEAEFIGRPYTQPDFMQFKGRHVVGVRGRSGERVWILLDGKYDSLYKQRPSEGQYDLGWEDYSKIINSGSVSLTVRKCLESHVVDRPRG